MTTIKADPVTADDALRWALNHLENRPMTGLEKRRGRVAFERQCELLEAELERLKESHPDCQCCNRRLAAIQATMAEMDQHQPWED